MCSDLEIILKILMCITLVVFIVYNVDEIIASHKYYKNCEEAHKRYLEQLINNFKNKE